MVPRPGACLLLVSFVLAAASASSRPPQFASSVDLVEVYATVTNRSGEPVTGLKPEDFEVLEDGRRQAVQVFAAGDFPLSVALAIDHSASMAGQRLSLASAAARAFLARLRPDDQAMVIAVSSEVEVLARLSADRGEQARAIAGLRPWSTTSLNDAVIEGIGLIQTAKGRRGLIVLSDGEDRYSRASDGEVLAAARRADVLVYPIALGRRAPALFPQIAVATGGRSFHLEDPRRIERALAAIARELRAQYLLGYTPDRTSSTAAGDAWRTIQVRVRQSDAAVRSRDGYYGR